LRRGGRGRVFVAGATGAVGRPLVAQLVEAGHEVVGTIRSKERADDLRTRRVEPLVVDALDADAALAVRRARPDAVVQQLTALPKAGAAAGEREHAATSNLRVDGTRALLRGAPDARMVAQSVAFLTRPDGRPVHDEDAELFVDGPGASGSTPVRCATWRKTLGRPGVSLRYGFLYGPGTWYHRNGASAQEIAEGRSPLVGDGGGLWPWLHVDDAASATVAALERGEGEMNVCDDESAPVAEWLPYAARMLGGPTPPGMSVPEALKAVGPELVHYHTMMPGASNARAKAALGWPPIWPD
jgi:2-alkyl-3-oxoalkanoate reductase